MKYPNIKLSNPFQDKKIDTITTVAIVSGLAIGAVIGALFATEKGKNVRNYLGHQAGRLYTKLNQQPNLANEKLGTLIGDVRGHIKQSAEGLLGPNHKRSNPSTIQVEGTTSDAWKQPRAKSVFPKVPDPSIKIV